MFIDKNIHKIIENIYGLWLREFKVFWREKSRLVASIFTPLLWLFILGSGIGSNSLYVGTNETNIDYQKFIFPGIVSMTIIFSSVFFGAYIIWDRKFDFLKSVMVSPVAREIVFIGKVFGGMTNSLIQVGILLVIGWFVLDIQYSVEDLLKSIIIMLLLSFALTAFGLGLGSYMYSLEGFQMIVSFIVFPLFFLSGALYSLDGLPEWLKVLTVMDPATYAVDGLRNSMLNISTYSFDLNLVILIAFTISLGGFGILSFKRMRAV